MKILVSVHSPIEMWNIPTPQVERLRREFPAHTFSHALDDRQALAAIPNADILFAGQLTREQFAAARQLRWIHSPAAGIGGMLFAEMTASPVLLTNGRGMSADTIAEHVIAVTLALFRRLPEALRSQAAREWAQNAIGAQGNRTIAGSHVLVLGLGSIGRAVARRMALLGARVTGIRRRAGEAPEGVSLVAQPEQVHELLPAADVVVVAAPHTRETRGLIGARELRLMKPTAILVNVSRGQLIDELALLDALRTRAIEAAALDVFSDEPLPSDSELWTLPNLLVTPHTSGFRADHWDAATDLFAENLRRFENGDPLVNVVDKVAGY